MEAGGNGKRYLREDEKLIKNTQKKYKFMKKRRCGQIFGYFHFHDGSWKNLLRCLYGAENPITPSGEVIHILYRCVYNFCAIENIEGHEYLYFDFLM